MDAARRPARVDLCGRLVVEIEGNRLEGAARGRQGRLLLAFLVLHRQVPVSRDRLAEVLWDDDARREPAGALNTLLSGLRRALGEGRLEGRRELRLELGPAARVDVELAVVARDAALDALARSSFAEAADRAREAVRLTEGEVLAGDHAEWLQRVRDDVRAVRADALEALARAAVHLGGADLPRAVHAATDLVELAPFRESAYGLLMEAHAAAGNVAEALRAFDRIRTLLRDELGTAPAPQLLEQHQRLLLRERTGGAEAGGHELQRPSLPDGLARGDGVFVGRAQALERLRAALGEATAGGRRFVAIAGEPGIGKTTLAARVAREAHGAGATVLYGRCSEEPLLAYEPFVDALCHGGPRAAEPSGDRELDELGRWMPGLGRPGADHAGALLAEPETRRFEMFEAMVDLLARLARDGPLLLVLDDLHWAHGSTLRLMRHLGRAARLRGLLTLLVFRDVETRAGSALAGLLSDLGRDVGLEQLDLAGLDDEEAAALIAASGLTLDPRLASRLRAVTAGNPFFLVETLHALATRSQAEEDAPGDLALAPAVKDMISRRLARLGAGRAEVLATAAVLGTTFRLDVLEEMAPALDTPVLTVLEDAIAARLVAEIAGDPHRFAFAHGLVRDALLDSMSAIRRLRLHRRAGEILEAGSHHPGASPAELAEHFFAARELGEAERALQYSAEAGTRAAQALAHEDAARQFERALTALDLLPAPEEAQRSRLLLALGEAQLRAASAGARDSFARAADAARGRSPECLALAAIGFGGRYYEAGVVDQELIALLEEALAALGGGDSSLRVRLLARLAEALHFGGEAPRALQTAAEALAMARDSGDPEALAGALAGRHVSLLHIDHVDERLAVSTELAELARREHRRELLVHAHHARLYDLLELGDVDAARQERDALRRLAAELRQPLFRYFALSWAGLWAQIEGRFTEAEQLAIELLEIQQELGARDAETVFAARLFAIRRDQGRLGEILPAVEPLIERSPHFMLPRTALPLILQATGDSERARHELLALGARLPDIPRDFFWLSAMSWIAEASAALHEPMLVKEMYDRLEPYAGRTVQLGFAACLGSVERLLGLLAAAGGQTTVAHRHFRRALTGNSRLAARALVVRTQADFAEFLAAADVSAEGGTDARELGTTALSGARQLGMEGVVVRLESLLRTA